LQEPANLSVLLRDGKERAVKFMGVDGGTGLSLLQPTERVSLIATRDAKEESLTQGQRVRLLSPNRAPQVAGITSSEIYVDISENLGILSRISRSSTGGVTRLTFKGENLSASLLGAIAVNDSGETIGFIDSINGNEAEAIPIAGVRRAVERIRQRVANKPRPWLGARGTSVVSLSREQLEGIGWRPAQVASLQTNQVGVVLTSVALQTPASLAKLRVGDVVVRVNGNEVRSAEEFSSLLSRTSEKESVQFTVISTDRTTPRAIAVMLNWTLDPVVKMEAAEERAVRLKSSDPLVARGIETLPITPALASRLKARGGRFVVFIHPSSPASRAGMLAGDIVESVDSRLLSDSTLPIPLKDKSTLDVVRNGQKLEFQIETEKSSSARTGRQ
jgi:S1-C subfamily serine protease